MWHMCTGSIYMSDSVVVYPLLKMLSLKKAARVLPPDALRLIYLQYCKSFYTDPLNQLQMAFEYFGPTGKLYVHRAKLRVKKRFGDPRYAICVGDIALVSQSRPLDQSDLDLLISFVMRDVWRARHHRMDMLLVCAKTICGDYQYTRPKRDARMKIDVSGPHAFVSRAVLNFLERSEVPIAAETYLRDVVRGRAAKLGDGLPAVHYFA